MKKELELYVHIPFCVKKCAYCDFLSGPADEETIEKYVRALTEEIEAHDRRDFLVTTIFFGGGTPSILTGDQMTHIMQKIYTIFEVSKDVEVSMEANPGTVTEEKLTAYRKAGINRISFGLQSTNNEELELLGRIHTYEEFLDSFWMARRCGFDNINVDLISAIPRQTLNSWEESVRRIAALNPEHISAYSLIIEEGTPFAKRYGEDTEGEKELPSEDEERLMYQRTEEILEIAGFYKYEISNYAKKGKECRHNLGYWERKNYLGIGLGASGLIDNLRYNNTEELSFYMEHSNELEVIQENKEELSVVEQMEEFIFLGLRKTQGICKREFETAFGRTLEECYGENIRRMIEKKMLVREGDFLKLTKKGIDVSNYVFGEILLCQPTLATPNAK